MYKLNEIVPAQLGNEKGALEKGKPAAARLATRIKRENGSEVLTHNGINNYILQATLKELLSNALWFTSNQIYLYCVRENRFAKRN